MDLRKKIAVAALLKLLDNTSPGHITSIAGLGEPDKLAAHTHG
ncbi:MAG TPA: hypothetical protein VK612_04975 [Pyrinomonadaceae bacterium]|nr:hypothetical protein [Pyrinomonadaceae bacterium]